MPRTTSYYGVKLGAVVIEKRKGTVSSIKVGTVDRNPPEGASWMLLFTPTREITDKATLASLGSALRAARRHDAAVDSLRAYDRAISRLPSPKEI